MKRNLFLPLAISLVLISSCKKETDPVPQGPIVYLDDIQSFYGEHGAPVQSFQVSAANGGTIIGAQGGYVQFDPGSFVTMNNQPVTGMVKIDLREVYNRKDMVLSDIQTVSNNQILISGGMMEIRASQNGQPLRLNSSQYAKAGIPNNGSGTMQLFYGDYSNNSINWTPVPTLGQVGDTGLFYSFWIDSLKWVNCDYFYNDPNPQTNVMAVLPAGYDIKNTSVFMSINGRNSVLRLKNFVNGVVETDPTLIPTGLNVVIGAIRINGKKIYSAFQPLTITPNASVNLNFSETTITQFKTDLANLP